MCMELKAKTTFWVFQQIDKIQEMNPDIITQAPLFNPGLFRPYRFVLTGMEEKYYTGLQVSRDPGTPVVAAAAVLADLRIDAVLIFLFPSGLDSDRSGRRKSPYQHCRTLL